MKTKILILWIALSLTSAAALQAVEYRRLGQDYRALAMGNTGIAGANGETALFYNPAALLNIQEWWATIHLQATVNETGKKVYNDIRGNRIQIQNSQDIGQMMQDYVGNRIHILGQGGISFYSNMNKRGFTIGANYMYEYLFDADIRNPALPEMSYIRRNDLVKQGGFSMPIGMGVWAIGFNYKVIKRQEIIETYDTDMVANGDEFKIDLGKHGVSGSGQGYDIGLIFRHPTPYKIQYGFVYKSGVDLGNATAIPQEIAVGLSTQHRFGALGWAFAMDLRDLTFKAGSAADRSLVRRLHVGTEIGIIPTSDNTYFLYGRGGYNQGYLSYGAELRMLRALALGYTVYQEETGDLETQRGDQREVYYLSFGWGF